MPPTPLDPLLPAWLDSLHRAHRLLDRGDRASAALALAEWPAAVTARAEVRVGAWCLGGFELATMLVAGGGAHASEDACATAVIDALCDLIERDGARADGQMPSIADWIVAQFGLERPATGLLEGLRLELLIDTASGAALADAIGAAVARQDWAMTWRGIERLDAEPGLALPASVYGLAATCLHHLGRYDEANRWLDRGLGAQQKLVAPLSVPSEAKILARWKGRTTPVVSIVCTTYNHERFLDSAMRGFLGQDCPYPFEVLVHDDASTDGTQALIRRWQQRYPAIVKPVLQTENQFSQGVRPWETMLARARGQFVALCEGDDYWIHPGKLTMQVGYLLAHPDVACSAHNHYHLAELTATVAPGQPGRQDVVVAPAALRAVQKMLWAPTLVFRRLFTTLPPEREIAAFGDQFLVSYLGTFGSAACFDSFFGAVRRENEFSTWSPLPETEKERRRVQTWAAIVALQRRLGHPDAVAHLERCIQASSLAPDIKRALLARAADFATV